jgi:hypothetical protein
MVQILVKDAFGKNYFEKFKKNLEKMSKKAKIMHEHALLVDMQLCILEFGNF